MADRITRPMCERAFSVLCKEIGVRERTDHKDAGAWGLDYTACYGGFVAECNTGLGGVTHPLGHRRMRPTDFYHACHFALEAVRAARNTRH